MTTEKETEYCNVPQNKQDEMQAKLLDMAAEQGAKTAFVDMRAAQRMGLNVVSLKGPAHNLVEVDIADRRAGELEA
jgi:hypothetical protein